ncbi:MAG: hypothetical protein JXK93_03370 [Sphaerochaetaceae bacterium]|nr:hypothetical protein [Sphaerochaetaceae bacterium]
MPYSEHRRHTLDSIEQEVESLRVQLEKKREQRDELNQELLSIGSHRSEGVDLVELVRTSERLEKQLSEVQIDMQHIDTRIWRLRHRAERLRHNSY